MAWLLKKTCENLWEKNGKRLLLLLTLKEKKKISILSQQINLLFLLPPSKSSFTATRIRHSTGEWIQQNKNKKIKRKREQQA